MNPIKKVVRGRPIPPEETRRFLEEELVPLVRDLRTFAQLNLAAPNFSAGLVVNGVWQVSEADVGLPLADTSDPAILLSDGAVRALLPETLTAPRTIVLDATGATRARTWELWKLDSSGFDYSVTVGAETLVLDGDTQWYLECALSAGGTWEALRLKPLRFSG
jgi:hypothetical protein